MDSVVSTRVLLIGRVDAGEKGLDLVRVPRADSLQQLGEPLQTQDWHRLALVGEKRKRDNVSEGREGSEGKRERKREGGRRDEGGERGAREEEERRRREREMKKVRLGSGKNEGG